MFETQSRVLIFAAHADDEALGCGGSIARFTESGAEVNVCFFTDGVGSRGLNHEAVKARELSSIRSSEILGHTVVGRGFFPDNGLDQVEMLKLTEYCSDVIAKIKPTIVLTHHIGDLNQDHRAVAQAVAISVRPYLGLDIRHFLAFEVLSSTECNVFEHRRFMPDFYVCIEEYIERKLEACLAYDTEFHPPPHPRSASSIKALANFRGIAAGRQFVEAFVNYRTIL